MCNWLVFARQGDPMTITTVWCHCLETCQGDRDFPTMAFEPPVQMSTE